jgi:hypothetical protein
VKVPERISGFRWPAFRKAEAASRPAWYDGSASSGGPPGFPTPWFGTLHPPGQRREMERERTGLAAARTGLLPTRPLAIARIADIGLCLPCTVAAHLETNVLMSIISLSAVVADDELDLLTAPLETIAVSFPTRNRSLRRSATVHERPKRVKLCLQARLSERLLSTLSRTFLSARLIGFKLTDLRSCPSGVS